MDQFDAETALPNRRILEDLTLPGKKPSLIGSPDRPIRTSQKLTFGASGINTKKQWKIEQKPSTKQILITEKVENICLVFVSVGDAESLNMTHTV